MEAVRPLRQPQRLTDSLLFVVLTLLIVGTTVVYVSNERMFYFWDYKGFQDRTLDLTLYLRGLSNPSVNDVVNLFDLIRRSTFNDYSHYPVVLPALAALLFGNSRLSYILSLMLFYMLPFTLVVGAITAKLIKLPKRPMFWSAAFVTAFMPTTYAPTLRGYPDISATLWMAVAIFFYLRDLDHKCWWHILVIGLMLTLAMLFRRHFVYGVLSFFMAAALEKLIRFMNDWRYKPLHTPLLPFMAGTVRVSLILISMLASIALFGPYFIGRLFNDNFGALYSSYIFSIGETSSIFLYGYGWIICAGSVTGFIFAGQRGLLRRPEVVFFSVFTLTILLIWILLVRQSGEHYPLHIAASVVVGLVAMGSVLWTAQRRVLLTAGGIFLLGNFVFSLNPFLAFQTNNPSPVLSTLISALRPPLIDSNYDEQLRLVNALRALNPGSIFVAASSGHINQNLLMSADEVARSDGTPLNILYTPDIDSRDYYPLEQLLQAELVVVATPPQLGFSAEEQEVVGVVVQAFIDEWPISHDFEVLPGQFQLGEDVVARLYRRVQPTSLEVALSTFQMMADYIGERPGGQSDWMPLSPFSIYRMTETAQSVYAITLAFSDQQPGLVAGLLYLNPLNGRTLIDGQLSTNEFCAGYNLQLEAVGDLVGVQTRFDRRAIPAESGAFSVELDTTDSAYLLFTITEASADSGLCEMSLQKLHITPSS